jgi:starch synthase
MMLEEKKGIKVLFAASEADPFAKVGGLADVAGSLPKALRLLDTTLDVRLVIPHHTFIRDETFGIHQLFSFPLAASKGKLQVYVSYTEFGGLPVYLIGGAPFTASKTVYGPDPATDGEKYVFFSAAVLELPDHLGWQPDIIHANDWHTALAPYLLNKGKKVNHPKTVLSIHNLSYMGAGSEQAMAAFDIPESDEHLLPVWARTLPLPLGLQTADQIVAVSPTYAKEILTPQFGCDLQDYLTSQSDRITGIINGLDVIQWDPANDQNLTDRYSAINVDLRAINKRVLMKKYSLSGPVSTPLMAIVSRLDQQKGIDLALSALRKLTDQDWNLLVLGTGNPALEKSLKQLEENFPTRVHVETRFDAALAHQIYGAADMLLIPSRFEPCGLTQMIAMRYGCLPVASSVGGLKDTILDPSQGKPGTGFLFKQVSSDSLAVAILRALDMFQNSTNWSAMQQAAMQQDFSWKKSAAAYAQIYRQVKGDNL